jgi:hypothetical protein
MSKPPRHWEPLIKSDYSTLNPKVIAAGMKQHPGKTAEEIRAMIESESNEHWVNRLYQVQVHRRQDGSVMHLNIRRRDGAHDTRDWRHFQEIKNQLAGRECEAFELYPAESRKVDTSNKFHLWVLMPGERIPVGWDERDVQYEENRDTPGIRQRAL